MKIELIYPDQIGERIQVLIDDQLVEGITNLELRLPLNDLAEVVITRHLSETVWIHTNLLREGIKLP